VTVDPELTQSDAIGGIRFWFLTEDTLRLNEQKMGSIAASPGSWQGPFV
jgi:hypothetical protein